eukprot:TRINITY_DN21060_c0_g1_i1.p1 TRINITY_DN21060_c0_g1~~TRINITY_DN21060_c0_g1_i1.p1  ORF type:complete len:2123 (+),score=211.68 TRINITY_DN21060_c0_g1_i1:177-6545(+)
MHVTRPSSIRPRLRSVVPTSVALRASAARRRSFSLLIPAPFLQLFEPKNSPPGLVKAIEKALEARKKDKGSGGGGPGGSPFDGRRLVRAFLVCLVVLNVLRIMGALPLDTALDWRTFVELVAGGHVVDVAVDHPLDRPHVFVRVSDGSLRSMRIGTVEALEDDIERIQRDAGVDPITKPIVVHYSHAAPVSARLIRVAITVGLFAFGLGFMRRTLGSMSSTLNSRMGGLLGPKPFKFHIERGHKTRFSDVAGCREAKIEIEEIVDFLKNRSKYEALGAKIPKGALLVGPPGTGKTLLAKATAGEAAVPFISCAGSDFVEMFAGLGPQRVRELFEMARKVQPCIIFIDEIDAVGRQRGEGAKLGSRNDERENTLNQLLVEMDGFTTTTGVVVLAGTNRPDVLDKALKRPGRFDRQIALPKPPLEDRVAIFKIHLGKVVLGPFQLSDAQPRSHILSPPVDDSHVPLQSECFVLAGSHAFGARPTHSEEASAKARNIALYAERLAQLTPGMSGADIANVVNLAALAAARDDSVTSGPVVSAAAKTEEEASETESVPKDPSHERASQQDVPEHDAPDAPLSDFGASGITLRHFDVAIERVLAGSAKEDRILGVEEKVRVAYNTAGAVVYQWFSKYADPILKVSIIPRGGEKIGFEQLMPKDRYLSTQAALFDRIASALAGRAAEEEAVKRYCSTHGLVGGGGSSTRSHQRMQQVTEMAISWASVYGLSWDVGHVHFPGLDEQRFTQPYSDATQRLLDAVIEQVLASADAKACSAVAAHSAHVDAVARLLMAKEVVTDADLAAVLPPRPETPAPEIAGVPPPIFDRAAYLRHVRKWRTSRLLEGAAIARLLGQQVESVPEGNVTAPAIGEKSPSDGPARVGDTDSQIEEVVALGATAPSYPATHDPTHESRSHVGDAAAAVAAWEASATPGVEGSAADIAERYSGTVDIAELVERETAAAESRAASVAAADRIADAVATVGDVVAALGVALDPECMIDSPTESVPALDGPGGPDAVAVAVAEVVAPGDVAAATGRATAAKAALSRYVWSCVRDSRGVRFAGLLIAGRGAAAARSLSPPLAFILADVLRDVAQESQATTGLSVQAAMALAEKVVADAGPSLLERLGPEASSFLCYREQKERVSLPSPDVVADMLDRSAISTIAQAAQEAHQTANAAYLSAASNTISNSARSSAYDDEVGRKWSAVAEESSASRMELPSNGAGWDVPQEAVAAFSAGILQGGARAVAVAAAARRVLDLGASGVIRPRASVIEAVAMSVALASPPAAAITALFGRKTSAYADNSVAVVAARAVVGSQLFLSTEVAAALDASGAGVGAFGPPTEGAGSDFPTLDRGTSAAVVPPSAPSALLAESCATAAVTAARLLSSSLASTLLHPAFRGVCEWALSSGESLDSSSCGLLLLPHALPPVSDSGNYENAVVHPLLHALFDTPATHPAVDGTAAAPAHLQRMVAVASLAVAAATWQPSATLRALQTTINMNSVDTTEVDASSVLAGLLSVSPSLSKTSDPARDETELDVSTIGSIIAVSSACNNVGNTSPSGMALSGIANAIRTIAPVLVRQPIGTAPRLSTASVVAALDAPAGNDAISTEEMGVVTPARMSTEDASVSALRIRSLMSETPPLAQAALLPICEVAAGTTQSLAFVTAVTTRESMFHTMADCSGGDDTHVEGALVSSHGFAKMAGSPLQEATLRGLLEVVGCHLTSYHTLNLGLPSHDILTYPQASAGVAAPPSGAGPQPLLPFVAAAVLRVFAAAHWRDPQVAFAAADVFADPHATSGGRGAASLSPLECVGVLMSAAAVGIDDPLMVHDIAHLLPPRTVATLPAAASFDLLWAAAVLRANATDAGSSITDRPSEGPSLEDALLPVIAAAAARVVALSTVPHGSSGGSDDSAGVRSDVPVDRCVPADVASGIVSQTSLSRLHAAAALLCDDEAASAATAVEVAAHSDGETSGIGSAFSARRRRAVGSGTCSLPFAVLAAAAASASSTSPSPGLIAAPLSANLQESLISTLQAIDAPPARGTTLPAASAIVQWGLGEVAIVLGACEDAGFSPLLREPWLAPSGGSLAVASQLQRRGWAVSHVGAAPWAAASADSTSTPARAFLTWKLKCARAQ